MPESVVVAGRVPVGYDLGGFSRWLTQSGVLHRIIEDRGEQVFLLSSNEDVAAITHSFEKYLTDKEYQKWINSGGMINEYQKNDTFHTHHQFDSFSITRPGFRTAPLTFIIMGICVLVVFLTDFGRGGPVLRALLIIDPLTVNVPLSQLSAMQLLQLPLLSGEWWRFLTPDLIHFSVLHIVFNLLLFWFLGGQIEEVLGSFSLALIIVISSVVSNGAQLIETGPLFGGISGVDFALIGFCWVYNRRGGKFNYPEALIVVSVLWLLLGFTPLFSLVGLGQMANFAHLAGLLVGLGLALGWPKRKNT